MTFREKLQHYRNSKAVRITIISILIVIALYLYFVVEKAKALVLVAIVLLVGALGMQITDWDLDLGKLWETGSLTESRVETKKGLKIFGSECISDNLNCANFETQSAAQDKYSSCAEQIARDNNKNSEELRNIDIFGLDGDNDGTVCEALPASK